VAAGVAASAGVGTGEELISVAGVTDRSRGDSKVLSVMADEAGVGVAAAGASTELSEQASNPAKTRLIIKALAGTNLKILVAIVFTDVADGA
jgi:hypothetical protein